MRSSLKTLQRLRKIREDQAAAKFRSAKSVETQALDSLIALREAQEKSAKQQAHSAAQARILGKTALNLELQARRQAETHRRAKVASDARRALLHLRSRELSSLEKLEELMAEREAEAERKAEAKELDELGRQLMRRKAA
jgi:flagellar export protein FliJ